MFFSVVTGILAAWTVIYFFDVLFKSCMLPPYVNFLEKYNLSVTFGRVQWYSVQWNRTLQKLGHYKPHLVQLWFGIGAAMGCILLIPSYVIIGKTLFGIISSNMGKTHDQATSRGQVLEALVPGINLPLSELPYYFLTILLSSVVHELGHAIAAARQEIRIQGCGVFVFLVFPGAFVDLPTDQMLKQTPWEQLKIFCAGVWHNVALVLVASAILVSLPLTLIPFSHQGGGVTVVHVEQNSGVSGSTGLFTEDLITSLNLCPIQDVDSWKKCLANQMHYPQQGYCTSMDFVTKYNIAVKATTPYCCNSSAESHLCFHYSNVKEFACLPVRRLLNQSPTMLCNTSKDCMSIIGRHYECLMPVLDNNTRLMHIERENKDAVLFVGSPYELFRDVGVTNYKSTTPLIPSRLFYMCETFLKYLIAISGALAILNIVPCAMLDGQWILMALVDFVLAGRVSRHVRKIIANVLVVLGTCILVACLLLSVYTLINKS